MFRFYMSELGFILTVIRFKYILCLGFTKLMLGDAKKSKLFKYILCLGFT